jgi:poly [ADP-ribose] polymerase
MVLESLSSPTPLCQGVYFADCSSKSANYCYTSRGSAEGIMLLCEVALGEVEERVHADSTLHLTLPKNKHSCLGKGRVEPDPAQNVVIDGDVVVPLGTLRDVPGSSGLALQYNECIVYSTQQIKFRYALRLR